MEATWTVWVTRTENVQKLSPYNSVPVAYNVTVAMVLDYVYVTRVNAYSEGVLARALTVTAGLRYLST